MSDFGPTGAKIALLIAVGVILFIVPSLGCSGGGKQPAEPNTAGDGGRRAADSDAGGGGQGGGKQPAEPDSADDGDGKAADSDAGGGGQGGDGQPAQPNYSDATAQPAQPSYSDATVQPAEPDSAGDGGGLAADSGVTGNPAPRVRPGGGSSATAGPTAQPDLTAQPTVAPERNNPAAEVKPDPDFQFVDPTAQPTAQPDPTAQPTASPASTATANP